MRGYNFCLLVLNWPRCDTVSSERVSYLRNDITLTGLDLHVIPAFASLCVEMEFYYYQGLFEEAKSKPRNGFRGCVVAHFMR